jgi:Secretion system C-terminal sorting domain
MKQIKLHIRLIFFGLFALCSRSTINAQTISYTVTGGNCAGSYTLTLSGTANGKNTYSGSILGNTATIAWSGTRWEINTPFGIQFISTTQTSANPPCHTIGVFTSLGVCLGGTITGSSGDCSLTTIPVELVNFTANSLINSVELNWLTASETNNKGFQIERSEDGNHFNTIDFVNGKGDSKTFTTYKLIDKNAIAGINYYYRLKQLDINGKESFSKIISIKMPQKGEINFAPNPANTNLTVNFQGEIATFRVYDILGKLILNKTINNSNNVDISALKSGNYIVELTTNNTVFRDKLIKY